MQIYLVGGAVRDTLLNYPIKERDWIVVGATPGHMIEKGYQQVGKDFPVYLHPTTKEEYALARRERKLKPGYYGFSCEFDKTVTLEQDLMRRDLTINAMAMDESGKIIDPYHGQEDLKNKRLRHVSNAFIEDPVRVLRVARFAARYAHLGFKLAPETRLLMYKMVKNKELDYLIPERVWQEWERSLKEKNPEEFINILRSCDALRVIIPEINALFGVPNPPHHHPEIDSGVHTLLVLKAAVELSTDLLVRFGALVHDLGKTQTFMEHWPSHHHHEEQGVSLIEALCNRLRIPAAYRNFAVTVSRFHLKIHRLFELNASTIVTVLEQTDAFRRPQLFEKLLMTCEADSQGRLKKIDYKQRPAWLYVLDECNKISVKTLIDQGYQGIRIKEELKKRRIACVSLILPNWNKNEK